MTTTDFNQSFGNLHDQLFAFAMKLTRNKENAKDLMQETAMRAYGNLNKFTPGTYFKSWVTTIMYNSFINHYRKQKTRNKIEAPLETYMFVIENKTISNQAHSNIMLKELNLMLARLADNYRIPFLMFFKGYHYDEIAEEMNLPIGTVKSRIFYARKQLKNMVKTHYGTVQFRRA